MRTARNLRVVDDPIGVARATLDRAKAATQVQRERLEVAGATEADAIRAFDVDDAKAPEAATARLAREKCERLLSAAEEKETAATAALRTLERAGDEREFEEAIVFVSGLPSRLLPAIERLEKLREELWRTREEMADAIVTTQAHYDHAAALAVRLEKPAELARRAARPTILDGLLLARVALALADKRAGRDDVNGFLDAQGPEDVAWNAPELPAIQAATATIERLKNGGR